MRQVVLDTETTGLEIERGHRVLEIGCVELIDRKITRRNYHQYINPQRESDVGALEVHGITEAFLADKPLFGDVVEDFLAFIHGAELVIHNAAFDVAFLDNEIRLLGKGLPPLAQICTIVDTLDMARQKHPGQKNSLDALCKRYMVDNSGRELHGALLDAEILADVFLLLSGGQVTLGLDQDAGVKDGSTRRRALPENRPPLRIVAATAEELAAHEEKLTQLEQAEAGCLWRQLDLGIAMPEDEVAV